ncbi:MAG: poly-gamma-glutamate system protein [Spirochaetia bacterium]|nr:poly-gamma-glutamate system protein [Spirochaetia bacterium]MCE1209025.1 poly-gamma-glutamate system protein [Spirochaetia bacterium]
MRDLYKPPKSYFIPGPQRPKPRSGAVADGGKSSFFRNTFFLRLLFFVITALLVIIAAKLQLPYGFKAEVPEDISQAAAQAGRTMERAIETIKKAKTDAGIPIMPGTRGVIGEEYNFLTTTLGSLSAKKSAENPAWASTLVRELWRFGLKKGDLLALGMSGSFPGLNIALISAAQALELEVLAVSSVTASSYGANQEGFTWPEMEYLLDRVGLLSSVSLGVSLGGSDDAGIDLQPEGRQSAERIARNSSAALGARLIGTKGFRESVEERLALYKSGAKNRRISLYVNIGGTQASMGEGGAVLELSSGFIAPRSFDLGADRGVMARMMEEGVPVLSLLNVKDLGLRWGIPID